MAVVVGSLLAWCAYLYFLAWLVKHTGKPDAMKHAATAAQAFPYHRSLSWLADLISRATSRKLPEKPD